MIKKETKLFCPKCKGTALIKDGKTKNGTQRYKCKFCGTRSSGEKSFKKANLKELNCKYCNSVNIRKKGFTKANNQMYFCNDCGKKFVLKTLETFTTQEKKFILKYYFCLNISAVEIAKHLGKTKDQVYYFLRKYKEKKKEGKNGTVLQTSNGKRRQSNSIQQRSRWRIYNGKIDGTLLVEK